jgi:hypothetical protein
MYGLVQWGIAVFEKGNTTTVFIKLKDKNDLSNNNVTCFLKTAKEEFG